MALKLKKELIETIPIGRKARIKTLSKLNNRQKDSFLPPPDHTFQLGPYIYRVRLTMPGSLKFTAELHDVIIEGFNDD